MQSSSSPYTASGSRHQQQQGSHRSQHHHPTAHSNLNSISKSYHPPIPQQTSSYSAGYNTYPQIIVGEGPSALTPVSGHSANTDTASSSDLYYDRNVSGGMYHGGASTMGPYSREDQLNRDDSLSSSGGGGGGSLGSGSGSGVVGYSSDQQRRRKKTVRFDRQDLQNPDDWSRWESERQGSQDSTTKDSGIDTSSTFTSSEDSNRGEGPKVLKCDRS